MEKTHYHNTADTPIYIGGVCILAGQAREVDARLVPGAIALEQAPAPQGDTLLDLLDKPTTAITAELRALTDAQLAQLEDAEKGGKTRKGVLSALAEARLGHAKFRAELQTMPGSELQAMLGDADMPADLHDLMVAEQARRIAENGAG